MYISLLEIFCNEKFLLIKFYQMDLSPIKREVKGNEIIIDIPLSSQFSSSNIQKKKKKEKKKKERNKNYTKEREPYQSHIN